MLSATDVALAVGPRTLLTPATFHVGDGDRVGLVGRNGAGKTTLLRVLAGEHAPDAGRVLRPSTVGYLSQDPRGGDPDQLARDRILSARGLDVLLADVRRAQDEMGSADPARRDRAVRRYGRLESELLMSGGYALDAEAAVIADRLGLPGRVLDQPLHTLSGGQRRRVELARILFSDADVLLLDEPTNHLDADSVAWLRGFVTGYRGGVVMVSHDLALVEHCVNRVFHLDATRAELDIYNLGWADYLATRAANERSLARRRASAERKAAALRSQADRLWAKATKHTAAVNMARRADAMVAGFGDAPAREKVAHLRFPEPASCGRTPLIARGLSKAYGTTSVFEDVDLAVDRGSRVLILGLNGAGKTTLLRLLAGLDEPDDGEVTPGHGLRLGYYAQEHETLDPHAGVLDTMRAAAPGVGVPELRRVLGSFLFSGDTVDQTVSTLSGGEKTRLALAALVMSRANVLLLDEPTNNLDPASRGEILKALRSYRGAIVLVTHDPGAAEALEPERVVFLPDGDEDMWGDELAELVALA